MATPRSVLGSYLDGRIQIVCGDITREQVEAIVNAANSSLMGGGGVDGAIHRAGGPDVLEACRELRRTSWPDGLPTGRAAITTGGNLPARYVIHTVGPVWGRHAGEEDRLLASCYAESIRLAADRGIMSLAFPSISTGAFGYPKERAARVASTAIRDALRSQTVPQEVRLVFFSPGDAGLFIDNQLFEPCASQPE